VIYQTYSAITTAAETACAPQLGVSIIYSDDLAFLSLLATP
jgi:hypothetical protein